MGNVPNQLRRKIMHQSPMPSYIHATTGFKIKSMSYSNSNFHNMWFGSLSHYRASLNLAPNPPIKNQTLPLPLNCFFTSRDFFLQYEDFVVVKSIVKMCAWFSPLFMHLKSQQLNLLQSYYSHKSCAFCDIITCAGCVRH